jgi:hypothetical protein
MSTRVIDDPTALGWVLDPATGRYEWGGSSGGGIEEAPDDGKQYARQSESWSEVDHNIEVSDPAPANPEIGQQWFSSADGYLYVWYGAEWVAIGGTA